MHTVKQPKRGKCKPTLQSSAKPKLNKNHEKKHKQSFSSSSAASQTITTPLLHSTQITNTTSPTRPHTSIGKKTNSFWTNQIIQPSHAQNNHHFDNSNHLPQSTQIFEPKKSHASPHPSTRRYKNTNRSNPLHRTPLTSHHPVQSLHQYEPHSRIDPINSSPPHTHPCSKQTRNYFSIIDTEIILEILFGIFATTSSLITTGLAGVKIHQSLHSAERLYPQWRNQRINHIFELIEDHGGLDGTIFQHTSSSYLHQPFIFRLKKTNPDPIIIPIQDLPPDPIVEPIIGQTQNNTQDTDPNNDQNAPHQVPKEFLTTLTTLPHIPRSPPPAQNISPNTFIPLQPNDPLTFPSRPVIPTQEQGGYQPQDSQFPPDHSLGNVALRNLEFVLKKPIETITSYSATGTGYEHSQSYHLLNKHLQGDGRDDLVNFKMLIAKNESQIIENVAQSIEMTRTIEKIYQQHQHGITSYLAPAKYTQNTTKYLLTPAYVNYMKTIKNRRFLWFYQQTQFIQSIRALCGLIQTEMMDLSDVLYKNNIDTFKDLVDPSHYVHNIAQNEQRDKDEKNQNIPWSTIAKPIQQNLNDLNAKSASIHTTNPSDASPPATTSTTLYNINNNIHNSFSIPEFNRRLIKYVTYSNILLEKSIEINNLSKNWILFTQTLQNENIQKRYILNPIKDLQVDPDDDDIHLQQLESERNDIKLLHYPIKSPLKYQFPEALQIDLANLLQERYIYICKQYNELNIDGSSLDKEAGVGLVDNGTNIGCDNGDVKVNVDNQASNQDTDKDVIENHNKTDGFSVLSFTVGSTTSFGKDNVTFITNGFKPGQVPESGDIIDLVRLDERLGVEYQQRREFEKLNGVVGMNPNNTSLADNTNPAPNNERNDDQTTPQTSNTTITHPQNSTIPTAETKEGQDGKETQEIKEPREEAATMVDFPPEQPPPIEPEIVPSVFGPHGPKAILHSIDIPVIKRI
jgi:hypothetical protein